MNGAGMAGIIFIVVLGLDVVAAALSLSAGWRRARRERKRAHARALIAGLIGPRAEPRDETPLLRFVRAHRWLFLEECAREADSIALESPQRLAIQETLVRARADVALIRDLHSRSGYRRARAATFLPLVPTRPASISLIRAVETERRHGVKLLLAEGLTRMGEDFAVPSIIDSLAGEPLRFQRSLGGLLMEFGDSIATLFPLLAQREEKEIQSFLILYASRYPSTEARDYLVSRIDSPDSDISHAAFGVLAGTYGASLDHERFLSHEDPFIRNLAKESLGSQPTDRSLGLLFDHLDDARTRRSSVLALTAIVRARPQHFRTVMQRCLDDNRPEAHAALVEVLSGFVDYLMGKLLLPDANAAERILLEIMGQGRMSEVVNFLNGNANPQIEERVLVLLKQLIARDPSHAADLRAYLSGRLLDQLGLSPAPPPVQEPKRKEHPDLPLLYTFLAIGAGLVPVLCIALSIPGALPGFGAFARRFLFHFNATFAVYALALNGIYLLLLVFSFVGARNQSIRGALMSKSFLFKENVVPSISIITPAFNEEASIVENVNSLLTLRYPDYEVIVVNDGSRDRTLDVLISSFKLERIDIFIHRFLSTQEIRGVYANKLYPELLVIDKVNGGKADSLNAGINVARKEYFAGIDADSMLERDALLNLAGLFLFSDEQVIAAGGNIFPVNGCTVRKGALVETRIPRTPLARFQTVEYIRSFMAGRVGWAQMKSLLIISGAFGVFQREKVVNAHGYLTRSGHYLKDTVGEDMELVVRLTGQMRESRTPFSIQYAYNANCWTEVPEKLSTLNRQRDRWQRGLLDIMTFHSRMIFNPRYGRSGLIGFPYFLIFEVLGPWFEAEGFAVLVASLALGAIGIPLFLLMFTATVLLGVLVSLASFMIAEYHKEYFPLRDKIVLVVYSVLENFGFRQLMSLTRVRGFVRMLARVGGWGQMERRGLGNAAKKA
jgi:peptidoglycan-N-acetylglucosamine deacetylase